MEGGCRRASAQGSSGAWRVCMQLIDRVASGSVCKLGIGFTLDFCRVSVGRNVGFTSDLYVVLRQSYQVMFTKGFRKANKAWSTHKDFNELNVPSKKQVDSRPCFLRKIGNHCFKGLLRTMVWDIIENIVAFNVCAKAALTTL